MTRTTRYATVAAASSALCSIAVGAAQSGRPAAAKASAPQRVSLALLSHVDPGGGQSADVWGHRGYAYLSSYRSPGCPAIGVRVLDVRNPSKPKLVSTFADGRSEPSLLQSDTEKTIVKSISTPKFQGDLAVTGIQSCKPGGFNGFALYDLNDPAKPRSLAVVPTTPSGVHELWLAAKGRRAYLYLAIPSSEFNSSPDAVPGATSVTTPGEPDFRIYDVTDPRRPVKVGGWGAWRTLGLEPRSGRGIAKASFVHSVITNAAATRAYLSYWDSGTVILDIANPAKPTYLGRTIYGPSQTEGDAHSAALAKKGRILIETHESPRANFPTIYSIASARQPRRLADFRLPAAIPATDQSVFGGVHDPKVQGDRVFFSWYSQGVVVGDISSPAKPRYLTRFVPEPSPRVWGVYIDRNVVLASDMNSGLWVLRLQPAPG